MELCPVSFAPPQARHKGAHSHPSCLSCIQTCVRANMPIGPSLNMLDDSVIVSLLQKDERGHGPIIEDFVQWCEESYLKLNISKTKDMHIDFGKKSRCVATSMKGQLVEQVKSYKYLGTIIDSKLNFQENCEAVCKKGQQRLHCLRKLCQFNVDKTMMILFYRSFIESILSFSLASWFGNVPLTHKNRLYQIVKRSSKLIGESQLHPSSLYTKQLQRIAMAILDDSRHPLNSEFQYLPSGRRLVVPGCRTNRFKSSFVPAAITLLNKM